MADIRRVYLDSCCFIDVVKEVVGQKLSTEKQEDVWYVKKLLEANRDKELSVYTSSLTIAECLHVGSDNVPQKVQSEFDRLLTSGQYVRLVQMTPFTTIDARNLYWKSNVALRGADLVHVASAIEMECEEFLSGNGKLTRVQAQGKKLKSLGLIPARPRDTACLPSKYLQFEIADGTKKQ